MNPHTKPVITEREVSRLQAHAGIRAREQASAQGGDPEQVAALIRAASDLPPESRETPVCIGGLSFHRLGLAVSLANTALAALTPPEPVPAALQIARLAFVFHSPVEAYDILTSCTPSLRDYDLSAVELVAHWSPEDVAQFGAYLQSMRPATDESSEEDLPGKSRPPLTRKTVRQRSTR